MDPVSLLLIAGGAVLGIVGLIAGFLLGRKRQTPALPAAQIPAAELPAPAAPETAAAAVIAPEPETKQASVSAHPSWHQRLVSGLRRTHGQLMRGIDDLFLSKESKLTREQTLEGLFEALIQADVGVSTSEALVNRVRSRLPGGDCDASSIKSLLREEMLAILSEVSEPQSGTIENPSGTPHVVLMVGVNGVGKTTTTGKLAYKAHQKGKRASVGAADTFRAAAVDQLRVWAQRSQAEFVELKEGADPASVAFESVKLARQNGLDLCIVDTAGRLHNRQDLMQELAKVRRVMAKEDSTCPHEVLLVLDATTGQNALQQARVFREMVNITGLVLTKLDGTAKGGVALAVVHELKVPIRYIGVGESVEDLEPFHAEEFVQALFEESGR